MNKISTKWKHVGKYYYSKKKNVNGLHLVAIFKKNGSKYYYNVVGAVKSLPKRGHL